MLSDVVGVDEEMRASLIEVLESGPTAEAFAEWFVSRVRT
jgi:hypothetical protein